MRVRGLELQAMIKYEDDTVLVVHKPPFLAVETRQARQQDLVSLLRNYRVMRGEEPYVGLVHRLDQPVEGLLVLGKTPQAAAKLSAGLAGSGFSKDYLAVVAGATEEAGQLIHCLKKDGKTNTSMVVPDGTKGGKVARLSYERLAVLEMDDIHKKSLLRVRLDTGRHHQIRVQLAHIGHPIIGDAKYGGTESGAALALCSSRLAFAHPSTGEAMAFATAPTGEEFSDFSDVISKIKW
jgi:23S rRNA pseudouridine1911/1915/1917 synthase